VNNVRHVPDCGAKARRYHSRRRRNYLRNDEKKVVLQTYQILKDLKLNIVKPTGKRDKLIS
jgi:hypothetical protein